MGDTYRTRMINLSTKEASGLESKEYEWLKKSRDAAIEKVASFDNRFTQAPYPSPFLNLSDTHIPRSSYEIFEWCKYYYTFDPIIAGAINALAAFPVTEIYFEDKKDKGVHKDNERKDEDSAELKFYKKQLFSNLNIYKLIVEIGIDYYLYGNCFIFGEMTRDENSGIEWKSVRRLDPTKVIIDTDPVTNKKTYKWRVPEKIIAVINKRQPRKDYDNIPEEIKNAVRNRGAVVLNPNNVYHFARPTDSLGENTEWGTPVIANVLKLLMYRNILRQAQEAIAREHIVPFRVYYMQPSSDVNMNVNWANAADALATELMKCVKDPNHKVVSPVPVGLVNVGGDGRALLLTPEIEQVQNEILAGMNVPREFIFGGVSYSGSSISLKILENQFITYRLLLEDFVQNFCIKKLAEARGEWTSEDDNDSLVTIKFNDLKMQDDVQQKQLIINLNAQGKLPDSYLFNVLGLDADKINEQLEEEAKQRLDQQFQLQLIQQKQNFIMQKRNMLYELKLERFKQSLTKLYSLDEVDPDQDSEISEEEMAEQQAEQAPQEAEQQNEGPSEEDIKDAQEFVLKLKAFTPEQQNNIIAKLPEEQQKLVRFVMQDMESAQPSNDDNIDMRPMPEQKPPRRDSLK